MNKKIQQHATTAALFVVLLLLLVRCSGQALDASLQNGVTLAGVSLELVAADVIGVETRDLGICVTEFRLYPNDIVAPVVSVPVKLAEVQFSEAAVSLGKIRQIPSNSYYLVELVLRASCEGASSSRFLKGEQYFTSSDEIVLRFRGNQALGYNESNLVLDLRPFLVALDAVQSEEEIKRFLHATEGSF